jgi:hypothetical protein
MNKFCQQVPDKYVQLNKWLEKKFSGPDEGINPERFDGEYNNSDIDDLEPNQQLQTLQHVHEFLASGRPFLNLRESFSRVMSSLNLPRDFANAVQAVLALEAWKMRYLHRYDVLNDRSVISLGHEVKQVRYISFFLSPTTAVPLLLNLYLFADADVWSSISRRRFRAQANCSGQPCTGNESWKSICRVLISPESDGKAFIQTNSKVLLRASLND